MLALNVPCVLMAAIKSLVVAVALAVMVSVPAEKVAVGGGIGNNADRYIDVVECAAARGGREHDVIAVGTAGNAPV